MLFANLSHQKKFALFTSIVILFLFFLSFLIPEWYTAFANQLNFFSNGWDEANYLTHQMALMLRLTPSYWFGENLYLLLEKFGISGSWQNLLCDTFLVPFIVILTIFILRKILNVSLAEAILLSILIWFSSVLFSYTNHAIGRLFSYQFPTAKSFLVGSEVSFLSILRTPNPQLSYFIIVAAVFAYTHSKRWFYLLLPLPFLYFPVFVFYAYIIVAWIIYQPRAKISFKKRVIFANLLSSVLMVSLMLILARLSMIKKLVLFSTLTHTEAYLAASSHHFQLPLIFVIFFCAIPILFIRRAAIPHGAWFLYITFLVSLLICSNTQVLTGVMFAPKIFQSSSAVIMAGIMLAILLFSVSEANKESKSLPGFVYPMMCLIVITLFFVFFTAWFLSPELWGKYFNYFFILTTTGSKIGLLFSVFSLAMISLYYFIYKDNILNILKIALLIITFSLILETQNFSIENMAYKVNKYPTFSAADLESLKKSPFILIVGPNAEFYSQFFPYAIANIYSPLQSVHYTYLDFIKSCDENSYYLRMAISSAQKLRENSVKKTLLDSLTSNLTKNDLVLKDIPLKFSNLNYCKIEVSTPILFPIISIQGKIQKVDFL